MLAFDHLHGLPVEAADGADAPLGPTGGAALVPLNAFEAVGGFDLLECDSLEQAVEIAATHPLAEVGTIEVRPLWGN